jgi:nucleoid DNA-binding protein
LFRFFIDILNKGEDMAARKTQTAKKTTRKASAKPAVKKTTAKASARKAVKSIKKPLKRASSASSAKRKSQTKLSLVKSAAISVGNKPFTKGQLLTCIAEQTGVSRKEVDLVLSCMPKIIQAHLKKQGPECFTWPGLLKIVVVKKPATKARWGTNPFTGEQMEFKAKPASRKPRVRALKALKEMVG